MHPLTSKVFSKRMRSVSRSCWEEKKRLFVVGLAMDFCVLDTCINAAQSPGCPYEKIYMVVDACRAAYIPGGPYNGFLSDPEVVAKKLKANKIELCNTSQALQ
mmetsp:Transcript_14930/g.23944  ORF Transcript_14930/g.23944 Transcript_14930/m.23944 type:complete len:103 (+) Transcript_14930:82-390(+)